MKKLERILTYDTDISKRTASNLKYYHELIHLYYDIFKKSDSVKLMTWDLNKIVNKHHEIVYFLSKLGVEHKNSVELDSLEVKKVKPVKDYEHIFENVSDFLKSVNFSAFDLYKYNAVKIINSDLQILQDSMAIEHVFDNLTLEQTISFVETYPQVFFLVDSNDQSRRIILNLKSDLKPMMDVKRNNRIFNKKDKDHNQVCVIHRLNTQRKTKIKIEGQIPEMNRKALNRIKNSIKKISEDNFIILGKFIKKGKKQIIEVHDLIYYDKRDISKEPIKNRQERLNKLFSNNVLSHVRPKS